MGLDLTVTAVERGFGRGIRIEVKLVQLEANLDFRANRPGVLVILLAATRALQNCIPAIVEELWAI